VGVKPARRAFRFRDPCLAAALANLEVLDEVDDWLVLASASSPVTVS
jgi:hypothetical protein